VASEPAHGQAVKGDRKTHLNALHQLVEAAYDERTISYATEHHTPKRGSVLTVTLTFDAKNQAAALERASALINQI
jgi:hypothetical protein